MDYDNLIVSGPYEGDLVFLRRALGKKLGDVSFYERALAEATTDKVKQFLKRVVTEEKMLAAAIQKAILELDVDQKKSFDDEKYCSGIFDGECVI